MKENESALYSQYIIDGSRRDMTPADLLDECMEYEDAATNDSFGRFEDIIDESTEPPLSSFRFDGDNFKEYITRIESSVGEEREFTILYPEQFTRLQIAKALISRLWSEGHFRLGDLRVWAQWEWNTRPIGNMASFYSSVMAASEYIYELGVKMTDYLFIETDEMSSAKFFAWLPEESVQVEDGEAMFKSSPYESRHPWISEKRKCASTLQPEPDSWVIYIPFDTCSYKLGGSLLSQIYGNNGGLGTQVQDPDYFIDCYEVVRELVEDGIVMAGVCVGDGGLAAAANRMCQSTRIDIDIKGIMSSYQESDSSKVLFGETPGVLLQIHDNDYDYLDSQLILQDVAYYPLGQPQKEGSGVEFSNRGKSSVAGILASLLGQASEGED